MTADEMTAFIGGLSEWERAQLARLLTEKRNEMQQAAHYGLVRRMV